MPLFEPNFLTRLEYLSIISKRVFRGSLLAQRRTMQLGSGIEFSDHREYSCAGVGLTPVWYKAYGGRGGLGREWLGKDVKGISVVR